MHWTVTVPIARPHEEAGPRHDGIDPGVGRAERSSRLLLERSYRAKNPAGTIAYLFSLPRLRSSSVLGLSRRTPARPSSSPINSTPRSSSASLRRSIVSSRARTRSSPRASIFRIVLTLTPNSPQAPAAQHPPCAGRSKLVPRDRHMNFLPTNRLTPKGPCVNWVLRPTIWRYSW